MISIYGVGGGITWDSKWESEKIPGNQAKVCCSLPSKLALTFDDWPHPQRRADLPGATPNPFERKPAATLPILIKAKLLDDLQNNSLAIDLALTWCRIALQKTEAVTITRLTDLPASYLQAQLTEQKLDLNSSLPISRLTRESSIQLTITTRSSIYQTNLLGRRLAILFMKSELGSPPSSPPLLDGIYRRHLLGTNGWKKTLDAEERFRTR